MSYSSRFWPETPFFRHSLSGSWERVKWVFWPFWCSRNSRDPSRTRPDGFSQNVSEGCRVMFQPIFLTEHEL
ncbi:hypothetical protein U9M48_031195 [Paspalum notatum var. saurae]|uniref:Uncharacterized protein n=1 Tax=Paspalum notatum var. saurae TaxID=547442 RepID=A0AAQ3TVL4_PASNO